MNYRHIFFISTFPVFCNTDQDRGYSTLMKKMILKNSLDVIGDDNTNDDDIKDNKYYNW